MPDPLAQESACTPRRRYAEREAALKEALIEKPRYKDPFTPLERWFSRLPVRDLDVRCGCGSGKPVLYWLPDDGAGCEECFGSAGFYIPDAVMYNIMEKFGITGDLRARIYDEIEKSRGSAE